MFVKIICQKIVKKIHQKNLSKKRRQKICQKTSSEYFVKKVHQSGTKVTTISMKSINKFHFYTIWVLRSSARPAS